MTTSNAILHKSAFAVPGGYAEASANGLTFRELAAIHIAPAMRQHSGVPAEVARMTVELVDALAVELASTEPPALPQSNTGPR